MANAARPVPSPATAAWAIVNADQPSRLHR